MSLNKVMLIGNVGQDPEVREFTNGKVANIRLATSERYQDRNGEWQESTEWHTIAVYGKLADVISQRVRKGSKLYVEGSLRTRAWEGRDGQKNYSTEVNAVKVDFLDPAPRSEQPQAARPSAARNTQADDDFPF